MHAEPGSEKSIFLAALDKEDAERTAFLDKECGDDAELRASVEALLKAHFEPGGDLGATIDSPSAGGRMAEATKAEKVSDSIGPYTLREQIGEGGMGVVYVAEQREPIRRRVALKIIKPGMDTKEVLARFSAERQALALMDHPNIAKVLDAGTTDSGLPYFVMELVRGIPITEFCDNNKLSTTERLQLFSDVCHAIQHAHQKGVIHRDIKPSNVLVASHDGKPVVKVIDFGVAKAINQQLTANTVYTGFAQMIGTPLYMSPEQAELSALDVDTRSDIYSLGVLLYELLTGSLPLEKERFKEAAFDEIRRLIREEEPTKPSQKVSTANADSKAASANRGTGPDQLGDLLRGDLDWIVMKMLEKDRDRRYETANGVALEVQRFLDGEPVLAAPPSIGYRVRKFVRRNRGTVVASSIVLAALILGVIGTTFGFLHANRQRHLAEQATDRAEQATDRAEQEGKAATAVRDFLIERLLSHSDAYLLADTLRDKGKYDLNTKFNPTILELLDRAAEELGPDTIEQSFPDQPLVQADLLETIGLAYSNLEEHEKAIQFIRRSWEIRIRHLGREHEDTLDSMNHMVFAKASAHRIDQALPLAKESLELHVRILGKEHSGTMASMNNLACVYQEFNRLKEAIALFEESLAAQQSQSEDNPDTIKTLLNLGEIYMDARDLNRALELKRKAAQLAEKALGPNHPDTMRTLNHLGAALTASGNTEEGLKLLEKALERSKAQRGENHPDTYLHLGNLGLHYEIAGDFAKALTLFEEGRRRIKEAGQGDRPVAIWLAANLAQLHISMGNPDKAVPIAKEAYELTKAKVGADAADTIVRLGIYADAHMAAGNLDDARPLLEDAVEQSRKHFAPDNTRTMVILHSLAKLGVRTGELDAARTMMTELVTTLEQKHMDQPFACDFLDRFADTYQMLKDYDEAIRLRRKAVELRLKQFGADDRTTLRAQVQLGNALRFGGEMDESLQTLERALERLSERYGRDDIDTLKAMDSLAMAYRGVGKYSPSIALFDELLERRTKTLGKDHFNTAEAMNNLATVYWSAGQPEKAIPMFEEAVRVYTENLGDMNQHTLNAIANLGVNYKDAGRHADAIALLKDLDLSNVNRTAINLRIYMTLTAAYFATGEPKQVVKLLEKAASSGQFNGNREALLQIKMGLVDSYTATRQYDVIPRLCGELIELLLTELGERNPTTLKYKKRLADVYRTLGQLDEAQELYEEIIPLLQEEVGVDNESTLLSMNALGFIYWSKKQFDKSVPLFEKTSRLAEAKHGRKHSLTLNSLANLASNYRAAGRREEGIKVFQEVYEFVSEQPQLKWVIQDLFLLHVEAQHYSKAAEIAPKYLKWSREVHPGEKELGARLATIGMVLLGTGKANEAEPLLRESLAIRIKVQPDNWSTFNTKALLGGSLLGQKQYEEAEPLLLEGYAGMKERRKSIHPNGQKRPVEAVERIIKLYEALEKPEEVAKWKAELSDAKEAIQ